MSRIVVDNIEAGYGSVRVLHGVSITVDPGETIALLGTNGNGKSTLLNCIMGIVAPSSGSITFETDDGTRIELVGKTPQEVVELGISLVPEGRRLFPRLTVEENLMLGAYRASARQRIGANLEFAFEAFPVLAERRRQLAGSMSGGEQQMLAIARALMSEPRILLVDEPSVGLAPILVSRVIAKDQGAEGAAQPDGADGGAELQSGDQDRGPRLHHRARGHCVRGGVRRRAGRERDGQAILSRGMKRVSTQRAGGGP